MITFLRTFIRFSHSRSVWIIDLLIAVLSPCSDRSTSQGKDTGIAKNVKLTANYAPLDVALKDHSWAGLSRKQTKELNPAAVFSVLGAFDYSGANFSPEH